MLKRMSSTLGAKGFTLVELITVVAVVAILASLAAPAMRSFIANQRVKAASFDLYATLMFARSEAIKRSGGVVRIAPVTTSKWEDGWTVSFVPTSGTAVTLRQQAAVQNIGITAAPDNATFSFQHDGRPDAAVVFSLDASGVTGVTGRCVSASLSGGMMTKIKPSGGC